MAFSLNIECTKDITELHINFADGTSVVRTKDEKPKSNKKLTPKEPKTKLTPSETKTNQMGEFLDTNADFDGVSQEIIKPPEIHREKKDVKVADELQNLDI